MGEIRAVLDAMPGISYAFSQPIDMRVQEMIIGARGDVVVKVFGDDIDELNRLTREVAATLRKIKGARDVFALQNDGMRYLTARVDRLAAGRFGLNAGEIQDALRVWVDGQPVGIVLEGPIRTPLVVRGSETSRRSSVDFARLPMVSPRARSSNCRSSPMCAWRMARSRSFARKAVASPPCSPMCRGAISSVSWTKRRKRSRIM